jgi:hypothetical protein
MTLVVPGHAEGVSPEPMTTSPAIRKILGLWIPGSGLRPAPE